MEQIKRAYEKLFNCFVGTKLEEQLCCPRMDAQLTSFTAMCGKDYCNATDKNGKEFRFMLVGRAVNGWDEYREEADETMTKEIFINSSIANLQNAAQTLIHGKDRFEWIDTESKASPCNKAREGIDRGTVKGEYVLSKAQIWSYTKEIWDKLFGQKSLWTDRWFEKIVWTNLYKVAPHEGGNPGGKLQKIQIEACKELLKEEIEHFRPTHIFMATAYEGWFEQFADLFTCVKRCGTNIYSGAGKNDEYVEAIAEYPYSDGSMAKVVVACRPEGRAKEKYVEQVVEYFK